MADPVARAPYPSSSSSSLLSDQELEAWLEDLESVLYPSLPDPSQEGPGLKQLWLEDIESVFYPPAAPGDPAAHTQRLSQLLLDDLESILYPPLAGDPSENAGHRPPDLTQVEFGSEDHPPPAHPLGTQGGPGHRTSSGEQREGPSAPSSLAEVGDGDGDGDGNPQLQPGDGRKSGRLPRPPPTPPLPQSPRGTKRRRGGRGQQCQPPQSCPCGRRGGGGGGTAEPEVIRLTEENALLRRRIEELTAEVGAARARLIERMVSAR